MNKLKSLTIPQQVFYLNKLYPDGSIQTFKGNIITWKGKLKSSPIGDLYDIKLTYKYKSSPNVYVTKPKPLPLFKNAKKLPHVYDHKEQQLCLYYPKYREWDSTQIIAKTILPWTIEWLYHYENWFLTGKWNGGGMHVNIKNKLI
ncbi:MAG: hypothetical protein ACR2MS_08820 [Weeksellaceae bacterium]